MAGIGDYSKKTKGNRGFKMKGHALPGPNQRSAFKVAGIQIGGEEIGSEDPTKLSDQSAQLKAEQQKGMNKYIEKQNEQKAIDYVNTLSDEEWETKEAQDKYQDILRQPVTTESGKTYEYQDVTYTGEDLKQEQKKEKAKEEAARQAEIDAYYAKQEEK